MRLNEIREGFEARSGTYRRYGGTILEKPPKLPNEVKDWLEKNGWELPK